MHQLPPAPICFPEMGLGEKKKILKKYLCVSKENLWSPSRACWFAFQGHQSFISVDFGMCVRFWAPSQQPQRWGSEEAPCVEEARAADGWRCWHRSTEGGDSHLLVHVPHSWEGAQSCAAGMNVVLKPQIGSVGDVGLSWGAAGAGRTLPGFVSS